MNNPTITKRELIRLGYGKCTSEDLIRQAKQLMQDDGYLYYLNPRLGRVPVYAIERILGVQLPMETIEEEK
jgi:hypothetical protein